MKPNDPEFQHGAVKAFEIMMQRGWHPRQSDGWIVIDNSGSPIYRGNGMEAKIIKYLDPFTALIMADCYINEIENGMNKEIYCEEFDILFLTLNSGSQIQLEDFQEIIQNLIGNLQDKYGGNAKLRLGTDQKSVYITPSKGIKVGISSRGVG